jgi:DNA-binding transcriptional ArsR family regulator
MKMFSDTAMPIEQAASIFAALGSEQRLSVLRALVRAGPDGLSIGDLGTRTGVTGSTLTFHLKQLVQAGLVTQEKRGRSIICVGAAFDQVQQVSEYLLRECCADTNETDHSHG